MMVPMAKPMDLLVNLGDGRRHEPAILSPESWEELQTWVDQHARGVDAALVAGLVLASTAWGVHRQVGIAALFVQVLLLAPLLWRRRWPTTTLAVVSAVAFVQWCTMPPLLADVGLLVGLYTVARHGTRTQIAGSTSVLVAGAAMASQRWDPAHTFLESFVLLTGLVAVAVLAGLALRAGRAYWGAVMERTARLERERDQQAMLAAAAERTRIAREMHDIVAHSVSIMVTLADGAARVLPTDAGRAAEAMAEVSATGRQALDNMRRTLGVLRDGKEPGELGPLPGIGELGGLVERIRPTGLGARIDVVGEPFTVSPAVELTAYRIVQEALTNTVKHAPTARSSRVELGFDYPVVRVVVTDDGRPIGGPGSGHGLQGMRERVGMFGGHLEVGPTEGGGWRVAAAIPAEDRASVG
jgi:signal transduction histidine kinase